jgi:hypothetical protein
MQVAQCAPEYEAQHHRDSRAGQAVEQERKKKDKDLDHRVITFLMNVFTCVATIALVSKV